MKQKFQRSHSHRVLARLRMAATAALVTGMMASAYHAFGHAGLPHDEGLDEIPGGVSTLLPDDCRNPVIHGFVGPLLPMHTMSVHNTLVFKKDSKMPFMLMFHRHSGYTADEVSNPNVIDFLINNRNPTTLVNAFGSSSNQFNGSMRKSFQQFAYGGYNIIHDVSQAVPTRIGIDQERELTQLWDMNHPDAFAYDFADPVFSVAAMTNQDAVLNGDAFYDMGHKTGLFYDMYCPGFSVLEDGRAVFMGGHDMNSQNGNYRIQVFDPEKVSTNPNVPSTGAWAPRPESCMRKYFGKDAESAAFRVANGIEANDWNLEGYYRKLMNERQAAHPDAANGGKYTDQEMRVYMSTQYLPDCNPHDLSLADYSPTYEGIRLMGPEGTVTHPQRLKSDLKYARWYPTQVSLPGNKIFISAGWDRDEVNPPEWDGSLPANNNTQAMKPFADANVTAPNTYALPLNWDLAGFMKTGGDTAFLNSRVKQVVPEVYDAATDTMIAMENSPFFQPGWYPSAIVVQTGPGRDDWKVAANDGGLLGDVPSDPSPTRKNPDGTAAPIGAHRPAGSVQNRHYHNTWLFDVQAALKDPQRSATQPPSVVDSKTSKYWTFLSDAPSSHTDFTGNANIVELDRLGRVLSHKLVHVGGQYPVSSTTVPAAMAAGVTTITTATELPVKSGPYTLSSPGVSERVWVLTATGTQVTLNAPTVNAYAANATLTVNGTSKNLEEIDFASLSKPVPRGQTPVLPQWQVRGELYQPGRQNYCTPLPDGTIMILGGNGGLLGGIENWSLHTQLYDPKAAYNPAAGYIPAEQDIYRRGLTNSAPQLRVNSVRRMAKTLVPRDEHGIIQLMPDATVYLGGQNRNGMVVSGDAVAPLGDSDLGVPSGQMFRPPYLYDYAGRPAQRPIIARAPAVLSYGKPFAVKYFSLKKIKGVSLVRAGAMSHSINTDIRLVKVAFKQNANGTVTVYPPKLPGTAVGGYYQMFLVDEAGVPSESVKVQLGGAITKRVGKPKSPYAITGDTFTQTAQ